MIVRELNDIVPNQAYYRMRLRWRQALPSPTPPEAACFPQFFMLGSVRDFTVSTMPSNTRTSITTTASTTCRAAPEWHVLGVVFRWVFSLTNGQCCNHWAPQSYA